MKLAVRVLYWHIAVTLIIVGLCLILDASQKVPGVVLGSALMGVNWVLLIWSWQQIFLKNQLH